MTKRERFEGIKYNLATVGFYHGRSHKVFVYYSKKGTLYDFDDHGNSELFLDYNFERREVSILQLYLEILRFQNPKMSADTCMLIAIREIDSRSIEEMAALLKMKISDYEELEAGTHGFNKKFTREDYCKILGLSMEEERLWMKMM